MSDWVLNQCSGQRLDCRLHLSRYHLSQAAHLGNQATIPLGVSKADLQLGTLIYQGQQGSVSKGTYQGNPVAVKRARIGTSQACIPAGLSQLPVSRGCNDCNLCWTLTCEES